LQDFRCPTCYGKGSQDPSWPPGFFSFLTSSASPEIFVCTPGRTIDLFTANSGRVTDLKRIAYLVLDEANQKFGAGFEPRVIKIVNNIRPDRQTVPFSTAFPETDGLVSQEDPSATTRNHCQSSISRRSRN
jgi:superfamily II DNA/RNA helicase